MECHGDAGLQDTPIRSSAGNNEQRMLVVPGDLSVLLPDAGLVLHRLEIGRSSQGSKIVRRSLGARLK